MTFDRFDICQAYYLYACSFHEGQYSAIYRILGRLARLGFKAGPYLHTDQLTENGRCIYDKLIESQHLTQWPLR